MAEITMPKLSDTMTEGVVVRWLKKKGDAVSVGDVLAEVETDKATMEMEAFDDGVLKEIYVAEGQKVPVGERIALIGGEDERAESAKVEKIEAVPKRPVSMPKPAKPTPDDVQRAREISSLEEGHEQPPPRLSSSKREKVTVADIRPAAVAVGRVKASPLARKSAARIGVELASLSGSGPGGRIVQQDVFAAASGAATAPAVAPAPPAPSTDTQLIPLTSMRRIIAQRMVESKTQVPHFYLQVEVNAGPLMQLRTQTNESLATMGGGKLSVNDFALKACVEALRRVPTVNSSFTENGILRHGDIHLGFAVSLDEGLITPVIRNAESKGLRQISIEAKELTERARARKLKPEEYQGGTFTVSNLGASGIDSFQAIINPPQGAILAVGSVTKKPVVDVNDQLVIGHRMSLSLSCDHRVVDGAVGARFLQELRQLIENPTLMLL